MTATCARASLLSLLLSGITLTAAGRQAPSGSQLARHTSVISGIVTSGDAAASPLRATLVSLNSAEAMVARTIVTDDAGRFVFSGLPPGRYTLTAAKPGYLTMNYGARLPGRAGTAVVLSLDGEHRDLGVRLSKGAAITGRVVDAFGEPGRHLYVRALQRRMTAEGRTLVSIPASSAAEGFYGAVTDDRGIYRLYGIPPGEYIVAIGLLPDGVRARSWLQPTTPEDIQRAMLLLEAPVGVSITPMAASAASQRPPQFVMPGPVETIERAPVYYPGTVSASNAVPVTLKAGDEVSGIDVQVLSVRAASVDGTVTGAGGREPGALLVHILSSEPQARVGSPTSFTTITDGRFHMAGLAPGRYVVEVRTPLVGINAGPTAAEFSWASEEIEVSGQSIPNLALTLARGVHVSGEVVSLDPAPATAVRTPVLVTIRPERALLGSIVVALPVAAQNGRFEIRDVIPGRYRITAEPVSTGATLTGSNRLWFGGATVGGRDAADATFEVRAGEPITDAEVMMTTHGTELAGALQDLQGMPTSNYDVIVFSTDRSTWYWDSRRIRSARLASDASFAMAGLPSGDYFVAALTDVEPGDWFDPAFLDQLIPSAVKVTLVAGTKTVQNLRIAGGRASLRADAATHRFQLNALPRVTVAFWPASARPCRSSCA